MDVSIEAKRRAYVGWLRTGRWPVPRGADGTEWKFNPWHDPKDGRFTVAGTGQRSGGGSTSGKSVSRSARPVRHQEGQSSATPPVRQRPTASRGWGDGGFTGPGGGDFGGGGATGYWDSPTPRRPSDPPQNKKSAGTVLQSIVAAPTNKPGHVRPIVVNGYTFLIDDRHGMIRAMGSLSQTSTPVRSRKAQASAGGADRRRTDDGGHYIAARFNGPSDAFNHFAQDANFNRGTYRRLENQWAMALRAHKKVKVSIVPHYKNSSKRPDEIDVHFSVNGHEESQKFSNESGGHPHEKY
jgi:hypothetical protein